MGDRKTKRTKIDIFLKLSAMLLKGNDKLTTEIFCQVIKQTTENPNTESNELGWQLLLLCVNFAVPTEDLRPYLLTHCIKNMGTSEAIGRYAVKTMQMCIRAFRLPPRTEKVTKVEVMCAQAMEQVGIRVYFVDGKYTVINVDSLTTIGELECKLAQMLGIKDARAFALFEVSEDTMVQKSSERDRDTEEGIGPKADTEERVLDEGDRIMSIFSMWNRFFWQARNLEGKKIAAKFADKYHFLYKTHYYLDIEAHDHSAVEIMYIQAR